MDTAFNATSTEQEYINTENKQIILDGLGRAHNRLSDIKQITEKLFDTYEIQLFEAIQNFTSRAVELMQNENALDIRLKLLKAKALQQTKSYKNKLRNRLLNAIILLRNNYRKSFSYISSKIGFFRKKYFLQPSDAIVTQEISDFLSESEKSIHGLPVIYRRLYKVEPVSDMDLFIGRKQEFETIKSSYIKWKDGRGLSTVIVSEKWGGLSSFINYLLANIKFGYPVVRICPTEKYYQRDRLFKLLSTSLSVSFSENQDDFILAVKKIDSKRIVIIEDMQHLYLRSMNGFDAIRSLIEIINGTHQQIFWILTCTQYAWNYLVKSIQIHDYIHQVVTMKTMNEEELNSVITKRNQIGGFKIVFTPAVELVGNKKFNSMSEEDQQKILEKRFFKRMNDFAGSNISMALIFWLLSTKNVTEEQIFVGDFENPDHSFIHVMAQIRIYVLLSLILHDGLSIEEISLVNNLSTDDIRLHITSLQEDGIIVSNSDIFTVNPLIYRNVVSVLKSKNLIH
jgi:hypothetical protein